MRFFRSFLIALSATLAIGLSNIQKPEVESQFVFTQAPFRQCHASTIAVTPEGTKLVAFFGGTKEKNDDVAIYLCRQEAGDTTWTAPVKVADDPHACWNPVLFCPDDNRVMLFYKTGKSCDTWRGHVMESTDDGRTWGEPRTFPEGMFGAIKNQPVKLKNGRIISPSSDEAGGHWCVHFEISDDGGASWRKVGPVEDDDTLKVIQPAILTCRDGSLLALCRSKNGGIASTRSTDNGDSWSRMEITDFPNNNSGIDAVTMRNGRHVLVCNPVGLKPDGKNGPRTPLCVFVSKDNGETWKKRATLESEEGQRFSYPTVICDPSEPNVVHVVYTWKRERIRYAKITF